MTFNITVPNANQSPALFPAQNNTNFQRLRDIINQEHNFLNTVPVPPESQGIHKQCTMINRAAPVALPAGNGIFYSRPDPLTSLSQLFWYNGVDKQITGLQDVRISGATLDDGDSAVLLLAAEFPTGGYMGTVFASVVNSTVSTMVSILRWSNNQFAIERITSTSGGFNSLFIAFIPIGSSGQGNLYIQNLTGSDGVPINWVITFSRIP